MGFPQMVPERVRAQTWLKLGATTNMPCLNDQALGDSVVFCYHHRNMRNVHGGETVGIHCRMTFWDDEKTKTPPPHALCTSAICHARWMECYATDINRVAQKESSG